MSHTLDELKYRQALPLPMKIAMTKTRIREWIRYYGEDGVYVSFSGGKDSAVLLRIAREEYPHLKAMFVDVPTQFPELRQYVKTFDNVDIVLPKMNFVQVCEKYGFPLFSKEICENANEAKKYWHSILQDRSLGIRYTHQRNEIADLLNYRMVNHVGGSNKRLASMLGMFCNDKEHPIKAYPDEKEKSRFNYESYSFLLYAPFDVSNKCCNVMKKEPALLYDKETGRVPITAQMADESMLRRNVWLKNGCNAFDKKHPMSNPMSFWTEQDVLNYIKTYDVKICSVYGDVVEDLDNAQISMFNDDSCSKLKCTGCKRTGCVLCGFGAQMKDDYRFLDLKKTHPGMYQLLDVAKNNGYTMRQAIDWINAHSDKLIKI